MDKTEFFISLGFSEYEAKALASFTKLKAANPKEISLDSGVPQNKLYSILKNFKEQGILASLPSETQKFQLINLKTLVNEKVKEKENHIKELKKYSTSLENIKDSEKQAVFSLIKGQQAIMNKLAEENPKAKHEILGVQRNWKFWATGIRAMQASIKKGVKVRLIGIINKETEKRAREWKYIGCKIKKYNKKFGENPLRFSILDNKFARITIRKPEIPNPKEYITIWTDSKPLIALLRNQFMQMWKSGQKF